MVRCHLVLAAGVAVAAAAGGAPKAVPLVPLGEAGTLSVPTTLVHRATFKAPPKRVPGLVLVDGDRVVTIATVSGPRRDLWHLAEELRYHLEQMSGRKIPLVPIAKKPASGPVIVIGTDDGKVAPLTEVVRRTGDELYIGGEGAGVSHALTYVLEALGCRYLFPGKLGKVIPKREKVVLPEVALNFTPQLKVRLVKLPHLGNRKVNARMKGMGVDIGEYRKAVASKGEGLAGKWNRGFWQWHGVNDEGVVGSAKPSYSKTVRAGHYFGGYYEKYGAAHPEWFAMQPDGTRRQTSPHPRLCLSNPALLDVIAKDRIAAFKARPEMQGISICMPDGSYDTYCLCPECRRLDPVNSPKGKGFFYKPKKHPVSYVSRTDRIMWFANRTMEAVERECPGKQLVTFVYAGYVQPPVKIAPHKSLVLFNVAGSYTSATRARWARESLAGWLSFGNDVVWRPNCLAGFGCPYPMNFGRKLFRDIEDFKANGIVGVSLDCCNAQYANRGFMFYMLAKAMLNEDRLDYRTIAADYCQAGFGKAAPQVATYFQELEKVFDAAAERGDGSNGYQDLFDVDRFAALLDKAKAAAGDDAEARARIDYLGYGIEWARESKRVHEAWKTGGWKPLGRARAAFRAWRKEAAFRHAGAIFASGVPHLAGAPYRPPTEWVWPDAPEMIPVVPQANVVPVRIQGHSDAEGNFVQAGDDESADEDKD